MIAESLLIGLIAGFIFYEIFEVSPGGVITPGYFALFVDQPLRMVSTLVVALLVWVLLEFLSKRLILYGRRKFLLALLLGFTGKILFDYFLFTNINIGIDILSIGYIIPGLIAAEMSRQSPLKTIIGLAGVTSVVYIILIIIY